MQSSLLHKNSFICNVRAPLTLILSIMIHVMWWVWVQEEAEAQKQNQLPEPLFALDGFTTVQKVCGWVSLNVVLTYYLQFI